MYDYWVIYIYMYVCIDVYRYAYTYVCIISGGRLADVGAHNKETSHILQNVKGSLSRKERWNM